MEYDFRKIEGYWQDQWKIKKVYRVENEFSKPKCYVLDMFPYPSGSGLHVGHPLGYIASDIYSRYKRLKGYNVLHPMGYDAFGLPAEQYAIEHGIHPAISTEQNINNFRKQLDNIGFCYDWDRTLRTSDANYYKWTQWIFLQLFKSFYNRQNNKAEGIEVLEKAFKNSGSDTLLCQPASIKFSADEWNAFSEKEQQDILMDYRLAFCGIGEVNWCEALGTVLANDEVVNGVSERGGHPVIKKKLRQWYLRITDYADRLLEGLNRVEFSDAMKEMQTNWIGKSSGAEIDFAVKSHTAEPPVIKVYTTRPDTIFGVDFMVIAPELDLVNTITTPEQAPAMENYLAFVKSRSERERMSEKKISGCFTGAFAINPFDGREIPVWISEYVLAGYGTGAIMAVPCGDERDHKFAQYFNIPITNIIGDYYKNEEPNATKEATLQNSGFLNGMVMKKAADVVIDKLEEMGIGKRKINYKMRDAAFSRQRYWGEPFPIVWKEGIAFPLEESELPLELPALEDLKPGKDGEGPLSNLNDWKNYDGGEREINTMPGYAGSSWYFLRYMDPQNNDCFAERKVTDYWNQVDVYIGGTEHAVGHLLYSRMWTKVLFDLGYIGFDEPFKKLVNQGMITGKSYFFNIETIDTAEKEKAGQLITSYNKESASGNFIRFRYGHKLVDNTGKLTKEAFSAAIKEGIIEKPEIPINWGKEAYILVKEESEKMSKSKYNVDNPDDIIVEYGADTFRMYEMFLGPVEQSKPWDTKGIEGVHRFLRKLWRLFFDEIKGRVWNEEQANAAELKTLHKTIKKIEEDTERFSFNTAVSAFMVCVNELADLKCHKKEILEPLLILLAPYAPHICEELWQVLGNIETIINSNYPEFEAKYIAESSKEYPVSINGRVRSNITLALDITPEQAEQLVLENEVIQKWLEGKPLKKFIFVKGRMINLVI